MTLTVTHPKVLPGPDDSDPNTASPSDWNAAHTLEMASGAILGRLTAGPGAVEELTPTNTATVAWDLSTPGQIKATVVPAYLTANQTITLSGDVSGSGTTSITVTLATVPVGKGGTGATTFTTGGLLIGAGTGAVTASTDLTFSSNLLAVTGDARFNRHSTDATAREVRFRKSRGTSGSPTAVALNDQLGLVAWEGYVGATNQYKTAAAQFAQVNTTPSDVGSGSLNVTYYLQRLGIGGSLVTFLEAGKGINFYAENGATGSTFGGNYQFFAGTAQPGSNGSGGGFGLLGGSSYGTGNAGGTSLAGGYAFGSGTGGRVSISPGDSNTGIGGDIEAKIGSGGGGFGSLRVLTSDNTGNLPIMTISEDGSQGLFSVFNAPPAPVQYLSPDATNLAEVITLANELRALALTFGFAV